MKIVLLKDIAEIIAGQSPSSDTYNKSGEGIPFFQGMADYGDKFPIIRKWCNQPIKISLPNDIIISVRAPVGPVNINNIRACIGRGLSAIRAKGNYSYEYLFYFLKANEKQISNLGVGSTFTAITQKELGNIKITVPETLADQIRIAAVLSKAEEVIKQRKENIDLLDEFLKSTFLKMFFQYFQKENSQKLKTLCTKITDGTHDTPERLKHGIKFITGKHIRPFVIDFDNSDYVTEEIHQEIFKRCNPEFGDILYTNIGVNLGTAAMNNVSYEFSMKNVALLKLDLSQITSRYLEHLLNFESRRSRILEMNSSGGAQQFLSLGQIKNIDIPVPPFELQKKFSEIVENSEVLKAKFKDSLIDLEKLFSSLSQKAFKGELEINLNDISLQNIKIEIEQFLNRPRSILETGKSTVEIVKKVKKFIGHDTVKLETDKLINVEKENLLWENISTQQIANWIKEKYTGYHFSCEMLIRFLMDEHVTFPNYYSSEELKKYPQTNEAEDIKSLIFSAINNENPFLKLDQFFFNGVEENIQLKITETDYEHIKDLSPKDRSGIYFNIIE